MASSSLVALNCALEVEGPETTAHTPVPDEGELAFSTALPPGQRATLEPALEVVGSARTMMETSLVEAEQGLLLIVQRKV